MISKAINLVTIYTIIFFLIIAFHATGQEQSNSNLAVSKIAGKQLFFAKNCGECHTLSDKADGDKSPMATTRDEEWFAGHLAENAEVVLRKERSKRRQKRTAREEATMLKAYLEAATSGEKKQINAMPKNVFLGAYLFAQNKCVNCHTVAGYGKDTGPDLTKTAQDHNHEWFIKNMVDPKQFAPDTEMPSFEDLPEKTRNQIADYLSTLK
ncbi:MAG: c-type cytochrome [bacterium]